MTEKQLKEFGKKIKHKMIDKNITQRELAQKAGVSEVMISRILKGDKKPPFDTVLSIAKCLGVKVDDLLPSK
ncbi:MAG: helix-turn-helix transcriptional regulator [Clostridia bacterium]|nr:helix-turn-helix transcriptional regulator [Clostridia bacterium]